jgi:hypothetical protein
MIFFFKFKILGISTKLIILCCFSLTTDPATWKNSRHLSKGFLYPFVFGPSFSIMPACVLMYSYRLCAFFLPFLFDCPHQLQVLVVLIIFFGIASKCKLFWW